MIGRNGNGFKSIACICALAAAASYAGLLGGLLGGGVGQALDAVGLGYDAKSKSTGGQTPVDLLPSVVACVNVNGVITVDWGYINGNALPVLMPIGSNNKLHPGGGNQNPPILFPPGRHKSAFTATFTGAVQTWILNGHAASVRSIDCSSECPFDDSLLIEPWDSFNAVRWEGDGDQLVQNGYFTIRPLAFSAFAEWKNQVPVAVESTAVLHLDQRFRFNYPLPMPATQSATVYQVNKDDDGTFTDYAFVNIGYTALPENRLFVEIFGADGGIGFDHYVETPITAGIQKFYNIDLRITRNAYSVAVDGMVVSTVNLMTPLPRIALFQVGVQRNALGLEGSLDATHIYKTCK